jgi:hypothetical protein
VLASAQDDLHGENARGEGVNGGEVALSSERRVVQESRDAIGRYSSRTVVGCPPAYLQPGNIPCSRGVAKASIREFCRRAKLRKL